MISRDERLLNLVSFLLKSRVPVSLAEIREQVRGYEVGNGTPERVKRRFERDKTLLRELGVPLEYVSEAGAGGPGYLLPRETCFLPRVELAPSESAMLATAAKLALGRAAGVAEEELESALLKLQFDSHIPGEIRETVEERAVLHDGEGRTQQDEANLKMLTTAVLERQAVRFTYRALGDERNTRRVVEPYGARFADGHWYLVGYDRKREDVRTFRLDRIRGKVRRASPAASGPEFDVPDDFDIERHAGLAPWQFRKSPPIKARVRFDPEIAFMVRMRPAQGDTWEQESDSWPVLTRRVTDAGAFADWVLGFGRRAMVLEPESLRDEVIGRLQKIRKLHTGRASSDG